MRSKKTKRAESPNIVELSSGDDEIVGTIPTISAQPAAKKSKTKIWRYQKAKDTQIAQTIKGKDNVLIDETKPVFTKNAHTAAKKDMW